VQIPGGILIRQNFLWSVNCKTKGRPLIIQPKLKIRHPNDPCEQEADRVVVVIESRIGFDLSCVRVHTDTRAGALSQSVNAIAFTAV
jgi:hypothetical protein